MIISWNYSPLLHVINYNTKFEELIFKGPQRRSLCCCISIEVWEKLFTALLCNGSDIHTGFEQDFLCLDSARILVNIFRRNPNVVVTKLSLTHNNCNDSSPIEGMIDLFDALRYNSVLKILDLSGSLRYGNVSDVEREQLGISIRQLLQNNNI